MKNLVMMSIALLASCVPPKKDGGSNSKSSHRSRKCYFNNEKISCKEFDRIMGRSGKNIPENLWQNDLSTIEDVREIELETRNRGFNLTSSYRLNADKLETYFNLHFLSENDFENLSENEIRYSLEDLLKTIQDLKVEYINAAYQVETNIDAESQFEFLNLKNKLKVLAEMEQKIAKEIL